MIVYCTVQIFNSAELADIEAGCDAVIGKADAGALPPEAVCQTLSSTGNARRTKFFFGECDAAPVDHPPADCIFAPGSGSKLHPKRRCFASFKAPDDFVDALPFM